MLPIALDPAWPFGHGYTYHSWSIREIDVMNAIANEDKLLFLESGTWCMTRRDSR